MVMKRLMYLLLLASLPLLVGCAKDNIVHVDLFDQDDSDDDINNTVFTQTVGVAFSTVGNAAVTGTNEDFQVTVTGNDVTIVYSGDEYVMYELSGTTGDGFFKLYSAKRQGITLNGVDLTNKNGAAINVQGTASEPAKGKRTFIVLNNNNSIHDGADYTDTPSGEDEKGTLFSEGQLIFSGNGTLTVGASGRSGIVSDDYIIIKEGTLDVTITSNAYYDADDKEYKSPAGVKSNDYFKMYGGSLDIAASGTGAKGISCDGNGYFKSGDVTVTVAGDNYDSSNDDKSAKGIKFEGDLLFSGSKVYVSSKHHEAIEAKDLITISDGEVYGYSEADDAINAGGDFTISGGLVFARATRNDALDANGNFYIKGGVVYAIGMGIVEMSIDANSEAGCRLYLTGGTLVALGNLEMGSTLTQSCYSTLSWAHNTWYGLTIGTTAYAFKTPSSGGTPLVVSGAAVPVLCSGVSVTSGTSCFDDTFYLDATLSGGSPVLLTPYNNGGGPIKVK